MENQLYVITYYNGWSDNPTAYTVNVPYCCKKFFDWLVKEDIIDRDEVSMSKVEGQKIAFEIKENK